MGDWSLRLGLLGRRCRKKKAEDFDMPKNKHDMVRLIRLGGICSEQHIDIQTRLRESGIAFKEDSLSSPLQHYLYVPSHDLLRARLIVRDEFATFAKVQRAKWEAEWRQQHGGSYFRWLKHQLVAHPKAVALRVFNIF